MKIGSVVRNTLSLRANTLFCLALAVVAISITGCGATGRQYVARSEHSSGDVTMYAMRANQFQGGGARMMLFDGPVYVGDLGKNQYLSWSRPAGRAELYAYHPVNTLLRSIPLALNLEAGKSFHVSVETVLYFTKPGYVAIQSIPETEAKERMRSLDIASLGKGIPTFEEATSAAGGWPGPMSRETRWEKAWPQLRTGMSVEELNSAGIFLLDGAYGLPGGRFRSVWTAIYDDGSARELWEDDFPRTWKVSVAGGTIIRESKSFPSGDATGISIGSKPIASIMEEAEVGYGDLQVRLINKKVVDFGQRLPSKR